MTPDLLVRLIIGRPVIWKTYIFSLNLSLIEHSLVKRVHHYQLNNSQIFFCSGYQHLSVTGIKLDVTSKNVSGKQREFNSWFWDIKE